MRYYSIPVRMTKILKTDHTGVGKDVEKLELPYAAIVDGYGETTLINSLVVSLKVQHTPVI